MRYPDHTLAGEPHELEFSSYRARIVQHEMDHLDGVLFTDRMAPGVPLTAVAGPPRAEAALREILRD